MLKIFSLLFFISISLAHSYGPSGCGFGSQLLKYKKGKPWNIIAATLNQSTGSQTLGMSSGTSGCKIDKNSPVVKIDYIQNNKIALANDLARGEGENLSNLLFLYDCKNDHKAKSLLKKNFSKIFQTLNSDTNKIHFAIENIIIQNKVCS